MNVLRKSQPNKNLKLFGGFNLSHSMSIQIGWDYILELMENKNTDLDHLPGRIWQWQELENTATESAKVGRIKSWSVTLGSAANFYIKFKSSLGQSAAYRGNPLPSGVWAMGLRQLLYCCIPR